MSEILLSQHLNTQGNVFVVANPGNGKNMCLLEPNLLSGGSNLVVYDPNGDLYENTKEKLEQRGYRVNVFSLDPDIPSDCSYEPFDYIGKGKYTNLLLDVLTSDIGDSYFKDATASFIRSLFTYVFHTSHYPTFSQVSALMQEAIQTENPLAYINVKMEKLKKIEGEKCTSYQYWQIFWNHCTTARDRIWSLAYDALQKACLPDGSQIQNDAVAIDQWENGNEKRALFLVAEMRSESLLPAMMLTQLMCLRMEGKTISAGISSELWIVLSEVSNIRYLPLLEKFLEVSRMYRTQVILTTSAICQLEAVYGPAAMTLIANTSANVFMGTSDIDTCNFFSKLTGERTHRQFPCFWKKKSCRILPCTKLSMLPTEQCFVYIMGDGAYLDGKLVIGENVPLQKSKKTLNNGLGVKKI